jgi:hypothetical protein
MTDKLDYIKEMFIWSNALDYISTDIGINIYGLVEGNPIARLTMLLPFKLWIPIKIIIPSILFIMWVNWTKKRVKEYPKMTKVYELIAYIIFSLFNTIVAMNFFYIILRMGYLAYI